MKIKITDIKKHGLNREPKKLIVIPGHPGVCQLQIEQDGQEGYIDLDIDEVKKLREVLEEIILTKTN